MTNKLNWEHLKNPWVILAGMLSGVIIGLFYPAVGLKLASLGQAYISLLSMCVIPIMAAAIITSIGRLFYSDEVGLYFKRIIVVFLLGLFMVSLIGLGLAVIGKPGADMNQNNMNKIGQVLMKVGSDSSSEINTGSTGFNLNEVLAMIIPTNIFKAFNNGTNLQILFFSIVFGISIGLLPRQKGELLLEISDSVFKAFEKAILLIMYLLPMGLMCMLSGQIAVAGIDILQAMIKFVLLIYLAGLILILLASLIISLKSGKSIPQVLKDLKQPMVIAFGTGNSYATMPVVFDALHDNFNLPNRLINLIVPLSIVICRYSMVLVFTLGTGFMAQMYNITLGLPQLVFIFCMAVVAAVAGAGAPGIIALSMITMVLGPLGLPAAVAITLLLAANAIIDPILTVINIYLSCAAIILIVVNKSATVEDVLKGDSLIKQSI
ncbi:MAG: hypothetical protein APF81_20670 [Desulfosporosinus sp. BRH_c37]|nr:MAG: hypothetical protein APF81_20670 [Desulfosporosinus sp. BRH_c37]